MAKSAQSKVIFVPMQLQSDVVGQMASHSGIQGEAGIAGGSGSEIGLSNTGRAAVLNSMSEV